jgi:phosphoribosylpyrophosphate synthetase
VARMLGEAVHRIHHDLSISALFREGMGPRR